MDETNDIQVRESKYQNDRNKLILNLPAPSGDVTIDIAKLKK